MSNLADEEARQTWRAERPDVDLPDHAETVPTRTRPRRDDVCTCSADPANDPNHNCTIHPPF